MDDLEFDQVNIVLPDVVGAVEFLRALGAPIHEVAPDWADWAPHHAGLPATKGAFTADLDSPAFASHWGGLPQDFVGVVVNFRTKSRGDVDAVFERALTLGAQSLRARYDAFWGARYAVLRGPGPMTVGIMSPADPAARSGSPLLSDFT